MLAIMSEVTSIGRDQMTTTPHDISGSLTLIGTPIGNLGDLTPRAAQALADADTILAEDTRVSVKLLNHIGVSTQLERCDEHTIRQRTPQLVERIRAGEKVAFVSDAGMPGISDPGQVLVDAILDAGLSVTAAPGPSAVPTAIALSGLDAETYYFAGFPPRKPSAFTVAMEPLARIPGALVFFESPHRVQATLGLLAQEFPLRRGAVVRELTKLHEEVVRGLLPELAERMDRRDTVKGEIVIVVEAPSAEELAQLSRDAQTVDLAEFIELRQSQGASKSSIAKEAAARFGIPRKEIYESLVQDEE